MYFSIIAVVRSFSFSRTGFWSFQGLSAPHFLFVSLTLSFCYLSFCVSDSFSLSLSLSILFSLSFSLSVSIYFSFFLLILLHTQLHFWYIIIWQASQFIVTFSLHCSPRICLASVSPPASRASCCFCSSRTGRSAPSTACDAPTVCGGWEARRRTESRRAEKARCIPAKNSPNWNKERGSVF